MGGQRSRAGDCETMTPDWAIDKAREAIHKVTASWPSATFYGPAHPLVIAVAEALRQTRNESLGEAFRIAKSWESNGAAKAISDLITKPSGKI